MSVVIYILQGSYAGNARGFKLSTLPKLIETKANKPRMTILHYAVDVATNYNKDSLIFAEESKNLRTVAKYVSYILIDRITY